jgi:2-dehydro-3-deoxyphosphogluconate aldolase/(4S)-4-hydroxy-2-oxoglutarate aldolase
MRHDFPDLFAGRRVMAILRGLPPETTVDLAVRAWDLGIPAVEVPIPPSGDLAALRAAVRAGAERGRPVGAGTVTGPEQVAAVADAGAAFTVAPGFDPEVCAASLQRGLPHLPGVATPGEVQRAVRHGLTWLKMFPAAVLGPDWLAAVRGPFPEVEFVATGGVDARTAPAFLAAGARAVAVGSALADPEQITLLADLTSGDTTDDTR